MPASVPYVKTLLRTIPRRDIDELAKRHLGTKRPYDIPRDKLMDNLVTACSGSNGSDIRSDVATVVTDLLESRRAEED